MHLTLFVLYVMTRSKLSFVCDVQRVVCGLTLLNHVRMQAINVIHFILFHRLQRTCQII